jgi:hypothetical protein
MNIERLTYVRDMILNDPHIRLDMYHTVTACGTVACTLGPTKKKREA